MFSLERCLLLTKKILLFELIRMGNHFLNPPKELFSIFLYEKLWLDCFVTETFVQNILEDGFIRSQKDSNNLKKSLFFKRFPFAVRFQIFIDETEVTNPLGSKTKKHELGMFCFRIENLAPLENSRLVHFCGLL